MTVINISDSLNVDKALKPANVLSTMAAMSLCRDPSKPKFFCFVSSTSVLDTDHYVHLCSSGTPIPESDDLEGSRKGLGTGYGQSKWVSEYLIREAGKRGLRGCIVRPGYVTGDTENGGEYSASQFLLRKKTAQGKKHGINPDHGNSDQHRRLPGPPSERLYPAWLSAYHPQRHQHGPREPCCSLCRC